MDFWRLTVSQCIKWATLRDEESDGLLQSEWLFI